MTLDTNWRNSIYDSVSDIVKKEELEVKVKEDKYYGETPSTLLFRSDSLFTDKFKRDLSDILRSEPDPGLRFKKKKASEKRKIVEKLDSLLETESLWKVLVKSSKYDASKIEEIFPSELQHFVEVFNKGFYPRKGLKKRFGAKYGSERCKVYFKGLLKYIKTNSPFLLNDNGLAYELTEKDLECLVAEIEPSFLFKELVKISMKKAYDTNINIQGNNPNEFHSRIMNSNFLQAKRTDLQYSITSYIRIYLANILLNFLSNKKRFCLKERTTEHIIKYLRHLQSLFKEDLHFSNKKTQINWFFGETSGIAMILLALYQETDVVKSTFKEKGKTQNKKKRKKSIIYVFNHKLDNSISFSHNLPRIIPPQKADSQNSIEEWLAPVKGGHSNIQVSTEALTALNIAQKKEFVVNTRYSNLLRSVDEKRKHTSEFTTKREFNAKKAEFTSWSESIWGNSLDITLYKLTRNVLDVKEGTPRSLHNKAADLCGITGFGCSANATKNSLRYELVVMRSSRQLLLTSLDISDIYQGYPLYYGTRLDFRLRMYPLQYLMSRTSGYLKNLLEDSVPRRLTVGGLINMLKAYYSPDPTLYREFNIRISNKKKVDNIKEFFSNNKINLSKETLYFELLESEITRVFTGLDAGRSLKTALQLEIDQVGSGPTLIALVTGNKVLAEKCNLLGGPFSCIYNYLLKKTIPFLSEHLPELNEESNVYKLLTEERKAQKYALMCFFYNEQHMSRTARWVEQYEELYGISVSKEDFSLLSNFSTKYPQFMEYVFPNLTKQLDLLNEALFTTINQGLPVKISTLDNCIISWDFDHTMELKKNYYNPVSGTHDQYKLHIKVDETTKRSERSRQSKHKLSFRPNFIHSLDASIMRMFLLKFYRKTGKKLNHLHDCVMLHPNDVHIFYDIVTEIYCSPFMRTLAQDLVFSRMKNDVVGPALEKTIEIEKEFVSNMDSFDLTPEKFDPQKCYRYEGAK